MCVDLAAIFSELSAAYIMITTTEEEPPCVVYVYRFILVAKASLMHHTTQHRATNTDYITTNAQSAVHDHQR